MKKTSKAKARLYKVRSILANLSEEKKQMLRENARVVTVDGRYLSENNTMMVLTQMDEATVVGGYNQWKAAGRQVRKGAGGLVIWVPTSKKNVEAESGEEQYFIAGTVFDISQTDKVEVPMEVVTN